ncbi:sensor kinase [Stylonychia lemnae]|uniref:Sensor kinase n=1 Tax=Stylonychia lemnae TaxID=5949 RepID=A0A078AV94_STYLE|nr:sensor kinase [Stylonychia lemnae]|eukprot:CDW85931.1 sensor kinase [Stylonychia lemnae]
MERFSSPEIHDEILQQPGLNIQSQNSVYLSHENIDNIETDEALKKLLQSISCSFDQNRFSMIYQDKNLEKEFLASYHQKIIQFGLIYTIEAIVVFAEYFIFQTAKFILLQYNYPAFKWAALAVSVFYFVTISIYLLAKKFIWIAIYFTHIQSIVVYVSIIESAILGNPLQAQVDGFIVISATLVSVAFISYDQRSILLAYIFIFAYSMWRTYDWIADPFRYARFNIFLITTLGIVYIFSRATHLREREKFEQAKKQKQLLKLFHNLIRVYHDGILITKQEEIVYSNKAMRQIFNIKKDAIQNLQSLPDMLPQNSLIPDFSSQQAGEQDLLIEERQFIQNFKKTIPKISQNQMSNTFTDADNENGKWFTDIWDYIQQHQKHLNPIFFNQEYLINPLDGLYFKFKYSDNYESNQQVIKFKILQVFTQTIRLGQKMFVMTTIRDQSNWLEIEKQKNLSQLKTIAFAQAAHEFRNPLNAINSSLQLLDAAVIDIPARQYLITAKNSSKLMLYLINDILDFSQLESKSLVLNYEDVNICSLIKNCFSILELKAQVKELELSKIIDPMFPKKINTDPNRLSQILINLLSNSIKYTNEGYVKIFAKLDQPNNQVNFIIKDSGVGMDKQQLSKLFTAFTKIMSNRDMNKDGVGLGLTISKNLAQALGGDIKVQSEINKGSEFMLILPIKLEDQVMMIDNAVDQNQDNSQESVQSLSIDLEFDDDQDSLCIQPVNLLQDQLNRGIKDKILQTQSIQELNLLLRDDRIFDENQIARNNFQRRKKKSLVINRQRRNSRSRQGSNQNFSFSRFQDNIDIESPYIFSPTRCQCSKILLVDDEPFNLIALQGLLNQYHIDKVDKCYNGKQAVEKIKVNFEKQCVGHQSYELVIIDNQMPVMNGIDACKEIRIMQQKEVMSRQTRIVLLTGDESMLTKDEYINLFDDVILKPIDSNILGILLMQTSSQN